MDKVGVIILPDETDKLTILECTECHTKHPVDDLKLYKGELICFNCLYKYIYKRDENK